MLNPFTGQFVYRFPSLVCCCTERVASHLLGARLSYQAAVHMIGLKCTLCSGGMSQYSPLPFLCQISEQAKCSWNLGGSLRVFCGGLQDMWCYSLFLMSRPVQAHMPLRRM